MKTFVAEQLGRSAAVKAAMVTDDALQQRLVQTAQMCIDTLTGGGLAERRQTA